MTASTSILTRLVQMDVLPGRPRENTAGMLARIGAARADGVQLIVFPEMAIPGFLIGDEWERPAFLRECEACAREISSAAEGIVVVFGSVGIDWNRRNEDGRVRKYNALFVAENGLALGPEGSPYNFVVKALMPNYRVFDDSRHFFDLRKLAAEEGCPVGDLTGLVRTTLLPLGCVVCEDAWDSDYAVSPLSLLAKRGARLLVNISASPYTKNKRHKRARVFSGHAGRLGLPLVFVNNVGIQNNGKTVLTFDGGSCVYDAHGHASCCPTAFEESELTIAIPLDGAAVTGETVELRDDTTADVHAALQYGTRRFMELCGVKRVVIGISGGVDSSVAAALYARLLDPGDLLLVSMPGPYSSSTTRRLAASLADRLGAMYAEVPINDSAEHTRAQIDGLALRRRGRQAGALQLTDFMFENVQARDRSSRVLAAAAAAFGGVFTCNANKSEATVGYSTLYGDLCGYLANIADLWKTEVYELARYLNSEIYGSDVIPSGSLRIAPSAELSPAHDVDTGKGDPLIYPYHDLLFTTWVEWWNRATPEDILEWYVDGSLEERIGYQGSVADLFTDDAAFVDDLERWWNLYQGMGLAKRIQAPPVLAVKRRAFGFDHREAQMGPRYTACYRETRAGLLGEKQP